MKKKLNYMLEELPQILIIIFLIIICIFTANKLMLKIEVISNINTYISDYIITNILKNESI